MSRPARPIAEHLRQVALAYAVLAVALGLTWLAWYYVMRTVEMSEGARFDEAVQATQAAINRRTDDYVDAMFGVRGLFVSRGGQVDLEEWQSYVNGIELSDRYEGFQTIGYVRLLRPEEQEEYVRRMRGEGFPGFGIHPRGEQPVYYPVTYVEPLTRVNETRLGFDMYSSELYRDAMNRARDTGDPVATGKAYVLSEADPGTNSDFALNPGFVICLPVYENGAPRRTVAQRREAIEGFIVGEFRMDEMLRSIFGEPYNPEVDFEIYDGNSFNRSSLLYDADSVLRAREGAPEGRFSELTPLYVSGHRFNAYFEELPEFGGGAGSRLPAFVLVSGAAISILLFGITRMLTRSRNHAERASRGLERANHELESANRELEATNRELEAFSYSVSHDLRAPLRSIDGFSQILLEDYGEELDEEGRDYLKRVRSGSQRMGRLIDDLLGLSRVTRGTLKNSAVDISALAAEIARELRESRPGREVRVYIEEGLVLRGDERLLRVALENLLGNAWKFTGKKPDARIEFGMDVALSRAGGVPVYYVKDNGAGFDMAYADKLFGAFQRLHAADEFEGTGIGLATVQRVIHRHGGVIWGEGKPDRGAAFYFTLQPGLSPNIVRKLRSAPTEGSEMPPGKAKAR